MARRRMNVTTNIFITGCVDINQLAAKRQQEKAVKLKHGVGP
jgi:hypothetical protein